MSRLKPRADDGATFEIASRLRAQKGHRLDVSDRHLVLPTRARQEGGDDRRPSALIADDQEIFRRAARQLLVQAGFAVVAEAHDGQDAVRLAASVSPSLVMLDIWMPGLDGIGAARLIRARRPDAVIILVTARHLDDLPIRAIEADVDTIVSKADLTPQLIRDLWERSRGLT